MKPHYCILMALLLSSPLAKAAIEVSVDRSPLQVNESFQLIFEADKSPDGDPDFSPIRQYFDILNSSQNNSFSYDNGEYKRSISWTLQLMPRQVGEIVIPAIHFGEDKTEPLQLTVQAAAQSISGSTRGLIFELSADRESVPVQGQIVISMRLMSDTNIAAYQFGELVINNMDVVIEPLGEVKRYQTKLDNKPYLVLEKKLAVFPQQSGMLKIDPVLGEVRLATQSRSIFDPFQTSGEIRRVNSVELNLKIGGIENGFSGQHWLPSTDVRLNDIWQDGASELKAGEPITRTIMMVAEGLTSAQLPTLDQAEIKGLKQYPDQPVLNDQRSAKGMVGVRQQKIALIPTAAGNYILPEISIPWWNLRSNRQEIATIPARSIVVAPADATDQQASNMLPEPKLEGIDQSEQIVEVSSGISWFWFWLSLCLAIGWLASMVLWWFFRHRFVDRETDTQTTHQPSLRRASKSLSQACSDNNASACRDALLDWANALNSECCFANLTQVALHFGEPLKSQIDELNQSLYSAQDIVWKGQSLWQNCESIAESERLSSAPDGQTLPALNP